MPASLPDAPPVDIGEGALLGEIFRRLEVAYGAEKWHWYAEHIASPIDVVAGAILVQHTAWRNAERALEALRDAGALDVQSLAAMPDADLQRLIRVSGTPSIKSRRL